ncbi:MAG: response regulator, partial [Planctomycetota bacterium]
VFSLRIPVGEDLTLEQTLIPPPVEARNIPEKIHAEDLRFEGSILVAEDNPTSQMLIKLLVEKIGFHVTIAKDGAEAVKKAAENHYDLIFMDIHMPNMNGYDATRTLRNNGIDIPIVALTANAMKGDDRKCLAAGCNDYLTKPIDRKWLLCVLQKYFDPVTIALTSNDAPAP